MKAATWTWIGAICIGCGGLFACGSDDSGSDFQTGLIEGTAGGCHVVNKNPLLRIGAMAKDEQENLFEVGSAPVRYPESTEGQSAGDAAVFELPLNDPPPEEVHWVQIGENGLRTMLELLAYEDRDRNGRYTVEADGAIVGSVASSDYTVVFFSKAPDEADKGYNLLNLTDSRYSLDFSAFKPFISTNNCESEER